MKTSVHGKAKRIIIIASLLIVAILAAILLFIGLNKTPNENNITPKDDNDSTIIDDIEPKPNDKPQPDDDRQDGDRPKEDQPKADPICEDDNAVADTFTLKSPAYVYTAALDAKNKTNPALTYQAGDYYIFKCYDGIVNITLTQGSPGGWIDPANPYAEPTNPSNTPNDSPDDTPTINVMSIDNTVVNWSHEYPTAFVNEYNGYWNISPGKLYLTFDCGYDYNNLASKIMDTLRSKNVKAVFFVTGDFMNDRPDLIKRMVSEGHIVGNHSYEHLNQPP